MAVVAHAVLPGVTKEQYDQVRAEVGRLEDAPVGGIAHVTWWEGEDCHNVDAWESEEAFNSFGAERLGPGTAKVGVQAEPQVTFYPGHEVYTPRAVRLTVWRPPPLYLRPVTAACRTKKLRRSHADTARSPVRRAGEVERR